jgi:uncharacterized protein
LEAAIIGYGRGPEIVGARITVYEVLDVHKTGWRRKYWRPSPGETLSVSHTRLSPPAEAALVVSITFGYFIIGSIVTVFNPPTSPQLSNAHLLNLLLLEPALAAVALFVLKANGNLSSYGLTPTWKGAAEGLALAIIAYAVCIFTYLVVYPFFPAALQQRRNELIAPDLMLGLIIASSIVNPLFEEFFVSGYLITTLKQWKDPWFAINVSVTVRLLSVHPRS